MDKLREHISFLMKVGMVKQTHYLLANSTYLAGRECLINEQHLLFEEKQYPNKWN